MSTPVAAVLALLVCLAGITMVWRDYQAGRSQLWMGGKPLDVTRQADPLLFWLSTAGRAALVAGVIALCVVLLASPR